MLQHEHTFPSLCDRNAGRSRLRLGLGLSLLLTAPAMAARTEPSARRLTPAPTPFVWTLPTADHPLASLTPDAFFAMLLPTAPPPHRDRCEQVAFTAWRAGLADAEHEYLNEVAKCVSEGGEFWRCMRQLSGDYRDARELARTQMRARLDLCRELDEDGYDPDVEPCQFSTTIDNPYLPLVPGRTREYRKVTSEGVQDTTITVLADTRTIDGFECVTVRDTVRLNGDLLEDTEDWYAQRRDGAVWYFGETARNYEDGYLHDLDGSWLTGDGGAQPGVVMLARPRPGDAYRQEFLLGDAEDAARVVRTDVTVTVPAGTFHDCLLTEDFTPIEPGVVEQKFYARGVGLVLEVSASGRNELIRYDR